MDATRQVVNFGPGPAKLPRSVSSRKRVPVHLCAAVSAVRPGARMHMARIPFPHPKSRALCISVHTQFRVSQRWASGRMHAGGAGGGSSARRACAAAADTDCQCAACTPLPACASHRLTRGLCLLPGRRGARRKRESSASLRSHTAVLRASVKGMREWTTNER